MNNETLRKRVIAREFSDISNWDVSNVTNMARMFTHDSALVKCYDTWQAWRSRL